ncbi:hypothetical protein SAMN06296273_0909 [Nitrosomonas ureae]|uniref:Uncharacterized protein n=1 Tax=Nitrosomonas ureae TaxID=44577 RepID=A0A285BVY6_9PROT|nr:hypothetical protein SAMN06296273_0909 [Nitrosomonas ureae]
MDSVTTARVLIRARCYERTPMQTLIDAKEVWDNKIAALNN